MKDDASMQPLWISHRGLQEDADENSLEAFKNAIEAGFTVLETDLRLSNDGHIILIHDASLARLTGDPRQVSDLSRVELEKLRLPKGGRLLFLDEFIAAMKNAAWVFDVKPEHGAQLPRILAAQLDAFTREHKVEPIIRFCTWNKRDEQALQQLFPTGLFYARRAECWRAGLSVLSRSPVLGGIKAGRTYAIPPKLGAIALFKRSFIEPYHRLGAKTVAFMPGDEFETQQAVLAGFDEILTDGRIYRK